MTQDELKVQLLVRGFSVKEANRISKAKVDDRPMHVYIGNYRGPGRPCCDKPRDLHPRKAR